MKKSRVKLLASLLGWAGFCSIMSAVCLWHAKLNVVNAESDVRGTATFPIKNPIDKFVLAKLQSEKIEPSVSCTDEEFLRRLYLDICGTVPPLSEVKTYLLDRPADRRMKLVDRLLKNERYATHWSVMWSDLLREHSNSRPQEGTERGSYRDFIQESLAKNVPYDVFVKSLIEAVGIAEEDGAVNFYLRDAGMGMQLDKAESVNNVATVFMGTRMACAQCHDHPFDKWTQTDFHSLMAFFGRTNVTIDPWATLVKVESSRRLPAAAKPILEPHFKEAHEKLAEEKKNFKKGVDIANAGPNGMSGMMSMMDNLRLLQRGGTIMKELQDKLSPAEMLVMTQLLLQGGVRKVGETANGEYRMPVEGDDKVKNGKGAGEIMEAKFPWNPTQASKGSGSRRVALAEYVVSNRRFAAVQVNRIWAHMFGRGIVDPVDDFRDKNPASNPELLEFLTDEFIASKYDNKHMIELIAMSSTYQRSSIPNSSNRSDASLFSHFRLRRMTAEQTFDSLLVATGKVNGLTEAAVYGMGMGKEVIQNKIMDAMAGNKASKGIQWAADLPTPAQSSSFMAAFNQPDRSGTVCKRDEAGSITQALEMMNGDRVDGMVKSSSVVKQILDAKLNPMAATQELFLAVLTRNPSSYEASSVVSHLRANAPTKEWLEDMYWALLNSREFTYVR